MSVDGDDESREMDEGETARAWRTDPREMVGRIAAGC